MRRGGSTLARRLGGCEVRSSVGWRALTSRRESGVAPHCDCGGQQHAPRGDDRPSSRPRVNLSTEGVRRTRCPASPVRPGGNKSQNSGFHVDDDVDSPGGIILGHESHSHSVPSATRRARVRGSQSRPPRRCCSGRVESLPVPVPLRPRGRLRRRCRRQGRAAARRRRARPRSRCPSPVTPGS